MTGRDQLDTFCAMTLIRRCSDSIALLALSLIVGSAAVRGAGDNPTVHSAVTSVFVDTRWNFVIRGYACVQNVYTPIKVKLLAEKGGEDGEPLAEALANMPRPASDTSDGAMDALCQSAPLSGHIFQINVPPALVRTHPGLRLRVIGETGSPAGGMQVSLPTDPVVGQILNTAFIGADTYVTGWACQKNAQAPLRVTLFRGAMPGAAESNAIGRAVADLSMSDSAAAQGCGRSDVHFRVQVPESVRVAHAGERLFVQAAAADSRNSPNYPLAGVSRVHALNVFRVAAGGDDETAAIRTAIAQAEQAAAASGAGEVLLAAGVHNVASCSPAISQHIACFELQNPSAGKLIVGGDEVGTELMMHQIDVGTFQSRAVSNNVYLMDFSIDYATPGFAQGRIVAVHPPTEGVPPQDRDTTVDVEFNPDPQFPTLDALCALPKGQNFNRDQWGYIAESRTPGVKHDTPGYWPPRSCEKLPGGTGRAFRLHMHPSFAQYAEPGDRYLQVVTRSNPVLTFSGTHNITLDNVAIHAGGGAASTWVQNTGAIRLDHFSVGFTAKTDRIMTTTADGFIALGNWATITITNSRFEGMGDDAINIHALGCFVGSDPAQGRSFRIVEGRGLDCSPFYHVGDEVQIVSPADARIKGIAKIVSLDRVPGGSQTLMVLDRDIPALATGTLPGTSPPRQGYSADLVYDVAASSPGSVIQHNYFGRYRGRGVVDKSVNSVIDDNDFVDLYGSPVAFGGRVASQEGPMAWGVRVSNNRMDGGDFRYENVGAEVELLAGNFAGDPVGGERDVTFSNNQFTHAAAPVFNIRGASHIEIENTYIETAPHYGSSLPVIAVSASHDIDIKSLFVRDRRPGAPPVLAGAQDTHTSDVVVNEQW